MNENAHLSFPIRVLIYASLPAFRVYWFWFLLSHPLYSIRVLADLTIMQSQTKLAQIFYTLSCLQPRLEVRLSKAVQGEIAGGLKKDFTSSHQEGKKNLREDENAYR